MLYVVATPIGNLKDITLRALEVLRETDLIIAENPQYTKRLLAAHKIKDKPLLQFAEHNEQQILPGLVKKVALASACLVTDAGTPGVSDPGFRLVRACVEAGIRVVPIPGPSAVIAALSASGLPTDRFLFVGFLPKTEPKLTAILKQAQDTASTLVAYESPQRIKKTVDLVSKHFPEVRLVIARELTKLHEEFIRGTAGEVQKHLTNRPSIKGEITILLSFK